MDSLRECGGYPPAFKSPKLYCHAQEWFDVTVVNESFAERLGRKLYRVFVVLLIVYAVLTSFAPMMNQVDLGWQVAQGKWIVRHFAPYSYDAFNYPNLGHPVINEYTLFEIILYFAWCLGWWGPCLLTAIGYATLIIVLLDGARRLQVDASPCFAAALGLVFVMFSWVAFPLRPHLATFICMTVLGVFLLRHRDAEKWVTFWPMAVLQIAWTNSHSAFVLGPIMVGLFGAEVTLRRWWKTKSFPTLTVWTWLGAFLLILLVCLINPYGWARFYPPFFQDRLESIRAYVGEMEPLVGGLATIYGYLTLASIVVVVLAMLRRGGAISFSFLLLAILFYIQSQSIYKAWPVFALFIPLLVLSTGAFATNARKSDSWLGVFALFAATVSVAMAVTSRLYSPWDMSLAHQWRDYDRGRSELPLAATNWLKSHNISGRLFHRCEDGGWLQMNGYDHGETYSDTGFGKYDEAFIHEIGLVNERPAWMPRLLNAYKPDFVVCDNFCFQWPSYLKNAGWRIVFYDPNSSVWVRNGEHADLPTMSNDEIQHIFNTDLAVHGTPSDIRLLGRNLISLHSLGLDEFIATKMTTLPSDLHHASWYWEAARFICFGDSPCPPTQRDAFKKEAERLQGSAVEFLAYYQYYTAGNIDEAFDILSYIPPQQLTNAGAELLLKIELERQPGSALELARRTDCFDLRNGKHWQYLAQAEEQAGNIDAARAAWKKAVFYYPDDLTLMQAAGAFATKYHDDALSQGIAAGDKIYGEIHDAPTPH